MQESKYVIEEKVHNYMNIPELALMYDVSQATMRTILSRPMFNKFYCGYVKRDLPRGWRPSVVWDCDKWFHNLMHECIDQMPRRKKRRKVYDESWYQ